MLYYYSIILIQFFRKERNIMKALDIPIILILIGIVVGILAGIFMLIANVLGFTVYYGVICWSIVIATCILFVGIVMSAWYS